MAIDGVFIHFLTEELQTALRGGRLNKIHQPGPLDLIWQIHNRGQTFSLLISAQLSSPRIHLTTEKWANPSQPYNFCMVLRKYLERAIIQDIRQIDNDRLLDISLSNVNELGDQNLFHLFVEIMGRNSNIILTSADKVIINSIRKLAPSNENTRIIIPNAKYLYAFKQGTLNPFAKDLSDEEKLRRLDELEGCSALLKREFDHVQSVDAVLKRELVPTLFLTTKNFYAFDLKHLYSQKEVFSSLSALLENVFQKISTNTEEKTNLQRLIKKELTKLNLKIDRQTNDLAQAKKEIEHERIALLLQANLYRVSPGSKFLVVEDFYQNNEHIAIPLNPLLSPGDNLRKYFQKNKKAKHAIVALNQQIALAKEEISYFAALLVQLDFANFPEIQEIKEELRQVGYLKSSKKPTIVKRNRITTYSYGASLIMVGKNNIQNNQLTHKLANKNDYWFHVKDAPGAHVVLSGPEVDEELIRICANLAASYSKLHQSSSVAVDYTQIKYVKKIPGQKGSNVTYKNQKTIYIDPNPLAIKKLTAL